MFSVAKSKHLLASLALIASITVSYPSALAARTFHIAPNSDIVGTVEETSLERGENLAAVSRRTGIGLLELIEANPKVHPWRALSGTKITLPAQYILPPGPRKGLVINLPELRAYYFHANGTEVSTFPIAIGKLGWSTPVAKSRIIEKTKNPSWTVPPGIMREKIQSGITNFPKVIPPGPTNPLGKYAIRLSLDGYLIHGTNLQGGIGSRVTHGCMRLAADDIETLFQLAEIGDPVYIMHQPIKVGTNQQGELFVEAHQPLQEYKHLPFNVRNAVHSYFSDKHSANFDMEWSVAADAQHRRSGIPRKVGSMANNPQGAQQALQSSPLESFSESQPSQGFTLEAY